MSINTLRPTELMEQRKIVSDRKNNTDSLTHANSELNSSHGAAARSVRNINDDKELIALSADVDSAAYFDEYDLGDLH